MKRWGINKYYDLLLSLEDIIGIIEYVINRHRGKIDKKYWDKYLKPK